MGLVGGEEGVQEAAAGREERILVSVRLRPLNDKEISRHDVCDWECINDTTVVSRNNNNLSASERSLYPTSYAFDRVFRPDCPTRQVYETAAKEVALSVLKGINSSIFAYGQTSSGKTYTMSGVTEYAVADIFNHIEKVNNNDYTLDEHNEKEEREFVLKFSALEIYNESVRDLLTADTTPLRLLDDPERGTVVEKLTEATLRDWNHFKELLSFCEAQRKIGETSLNEASSRSHQILKLTVESCPCDFLVIDRSSSLAASVNFIDLAGSERASQTHAAGARLKEGSHINRSLLTLGTCIRKLSKGGKGGHIPFRDSKLTRILQSSLGGNAKTAIICTMSPARSHAEQTRNTLLFASCARQVSTSPQVNAVLSDKALVKQLQKELTRLETELRSSLASQRKSNSVEVLKEKDLEIEKLRKEISDLTMQRDLAQSQIKDMLQVVGDELSSSESEGSDIRYPRLRVGRSWDFENQQDGPNLFSLNSFNKIKYFENSLYLDGNSFSSDDNFFQLPDLEKHLPLRISPLILPILTPDHHVDSNQNNTKQKTKCIIDSEGTISDSSASSPEANTIRLGGKKLTEGVDFTHEENNNAYFELKKKKDFIPLPLRNKLSPSPRPGYAKMTRSTSCKASIMRDPSPDWFDEEDIARYGTPMVVGMGKERPVGFPSRSHTLNYDADAERASPFRDGNPPGSASITTPEHVRRVTFKDIDANGSLVSELKEKIDLGSSNNNLQRNHEESKDVALGSKQSEDEKNSNWPSEFKRLQREIVELWNVCNVSLVHRSYFFLLFKGDPSDSIYMEVELRRLSYLKQTFSPDSSAKYLKKERQMLSKKMHKKLPKSERNKLYVEWRIDRHSKHRRLQLANLLWSDTEDMDRVRESAAIVTRLVGTVEPDQAYKEMFGLNFAPRRKPKKSFAWTATMKKRIL
ncbi:kinesin-like protein KIN-7G [Arachis stenosperma]|uniref:kinesin-like protein KIN-7G n=1 Tax=Arachis stenosperma TaxID=217475 RepID=UPI0025AC225C|nr:kinesin-like protein KIN-7G [Arachis stenosperma]